ncbi:MAG: HTTM domain-containing protein [Polyangiales bacterium]
MLGEPLRTWLAASTDVLGLFAHALAAQYPGSKVHADVWVSLNGRKAARLIDPSVDLARERDTLWNKRWILPE